MGWRERGAVALVGILGALATSPGVAFAQPVQPSGPDPWIVDRPRFEPIDAAGITVETIGDYRGGIEIARSPNGTNRLAVINHVGLEDYLKGISEVPSAWPLEAQKAQAVAARTYALYELTKNTNTSATRQAGADLCATDSCQVYAGMAKERRPGSEAWSAAVAQTKNQVLLYKDAPIVAKYSSSNGGETVGGGQPYLRGAVPDPDDAYSPMHRWRASYPIADVARIAGLAAEPVELHRDDEEIVATYVDPDGNPVEQRVAVEDFRDRVNRGFATPAGLPLPVPSRRFDVMADDGLVRLDGRGWGHGIGLSQYGALGKALRGMKFADILAAYYAGLKPTALPADRMPQDLKVALALDRTDVGVGAAAGRFRIVDGSGRVLAHSAAGIWRATTAPDGRIKLTPPPDQIGPPGATIAAVRPDQPKAGKPLALTVQLDGPGALTTINLVRPDGTTQMVDSARLRAPGPVQIRVGDAVQAGTYHLDLERDAGNGRVATTTLTVDVAAGSGSAGASTRTDDTAHTGDTGQAQDPDLDLAFAGAEALPSAPIPTRLLQAMATFMLLAVMVLGGFWVGRRPGSELH